MERCASYFAALTRCGDNLREQFWRKHGFGFGDSSLLSLHHIPSHPCISVQSSMQMLLVLLSTLLHFISKSTSTSFNQARGHPPASAPAELIRHNSFVLKWRLPMTPRRLTLPQLSKVSASPTHRDVLAAQAGHPRPPAARLVEWPLGSRDRQGRVLRAQLAASLIPGVPILEQCRPTRSRRGPAQHPPVLGCAPAPRRVVRDRPRRGGRALSRGHGMPIRGC